MNRTVIIILIAIFACLILFAISCICLASGIVLWGLTQQETPMLYEPQPDATSQYQSSPTQTPFVIRPTQDDEPPALASPEPPEPTEDAASENPAPTQTSPGAQPGALVPIDTLKLLEDTIVPINDPLDLARRLEGKENLPRSLEGPPVVFSIGESRDFWVTNTDNNQNSQIGATLRYETQHVYFWIQDGVQYRQDQLEELVETFENEIYPTNREFFGSEWTPGVDADEHLHILYARGLGGSVAGYFSTVDEYLPIVRDDSNGHEMFLLSVDHLELDEEFTYGVLAHEFQHMIHWYQDRNEDTWVNEGFSDLAMFLNNYSIGGADYAYVLDPDLQLTDWPTEPTNRSAHYGASFLFLTYFLDRFGEDATKSLVAEPANGMVSIDLVLEALDIIDPLREKAIGADDVFADWVLASYLQDSSIADGRYDYNNYPQAPNPSETEDIRSCPLDLITRDVSQYGVDYIRINCRGEHTLSFEGSIQVGVLPADPYSGSYAYYSNMGDESDMTLTHTFDFSDHTGPLTLKYWTWYDLEEDYDYLYLTASLDGENWQILITPSGTGDDPSGNSFGWAYNALSGGGPRWIQESVDISQFAGEEVQLRFEYVTDAAVNGDGLLLDDIAIPEIDYFSDFEQDGGGWEAQGFVRIQNILPQTFRLALISFGDTVSVEYIDLPLDNSVNIPLTFDGDVDEYVLVVSGTTRFTRQKAAYQFSIQP